VLTGPVKEYP